MKEKNKKQEFSFVYKCEQLKNLKTSKIIFIPINYIYHEKIK